MSTKKKKAPSRTDVRGVNFDLTIASCDLIDAAQARLAAQNPRGRCSRVDALEKLIAEGAKVVLFDATPCGPKK